jgi:hypothetical protein
MATRGKSGFQQPRTALHSEVLSPIPRSYRDAPTQWRNKWVVQVVLGLPQIPGDQGKGAL